VGAQGLPHPGQGLRGYRGNHGLLRQQRADSYRVLWGPGTCQEQLLLNPGRQACRSRGGWA